MTSETRDTYVWTWLPGETQPVVAGRLEWRNGLLTYTYARSYLGREHAISLYTPELPLRRGRIEPRVGLTAPSCILDARPDAWGQRVILNRLTGRDWNAQDPGELDDLTYLLESGSNRVGAIDVQTSANDYAPRGGAPATLGELATSAQRVEAGIPLSPSLDAALLHGSSIGGARPKAQLEDAGRQLIAKFSASNDTYAVVQAEFVAMRLAARAGLRVATVELSRALGKDVLLVERFDRSPTSRERRHFVSALTILGLRDLDAAYASYADLAERVRHEFTEPAATLRELFARLTFNVIIGNTDDHARNHGALWDGELLSLSPAYDLCPQRREGGEASQGMMIAPGPRGYRLSNLLGCIEHARYFGLSATQAREIVDHQLMVVERDWLELCDLAGMSEVDRTLLWGRAVMSPFSLEGYSAAT